MTLEYDNFVEDYINSINIIPEYVFITRDYSLETMQLEISFCELLFKYGFINSETIASWLKIDDQGNSLSTVGERYCIKKSNNYYYLVSAHTNKDFLKKVNSSLLHSFELEHNIKWLRTPLFSLFTLVNNLELENAKEILFKSVEVNKISTELDSIFKESYFHIDKIKCSTDSSISKGNSNILIRSFVINDKKISLPFCDIGHGGIPYFPYDADIPLANTRYLTDRTKIVVLTDSTELAGLYQNRKLSDEVVCLSWYDKSGDVGLDKIDWSKLNGKRIYYMIHPHSCLSTKELLAKADAVKEFVESAKIKSFKFISCISSYTNSDIVLTSSDVMPPVILTTSEYEALRNVERKPPSEFNLVAPQGFDLRHPCFGNLEREALVSPIIYSNSQTILVGQPGSGRSLFALGCAYSAATNFEFFSGWRGRKKRKVLYLFDSVDKNSLKKSLEAIHKYFDEKHKAQSPYNRPLPQSDQIVDFLEINPEYIREQTEFFERINTWDRKASAIINGITRVTSDYDLVIIDDCFELNVESIIAIKRLSSFFTINALSLLLTVKEDSVRKSRDLRKKVQFDNTISLKRLKPADSGSFRMSVKIEEGVRLSRNIDQDFTCELDWSKEYPVFRKLKQFRKKYSEWSTRSKEERMNEVHRLYTEKNMKLQEIAVEMEISLAQVNNLRKMKKDLDNEKAANKQGPLPPPHGLNSK